MLSPPRKRYSERRGRLNGKSMLTYKRLPKAERVKVTALSPSGKIRPQTLDAAYAPVEEVLISLKTSEAGVSDQEARNRLVERGFNEVTYSETVSLAWQFIRNFGNPFVALLSVLSLIAFLLGDNRGAVLILVMVVVSVLLRFVQEFRSNRTVAKLRNLVGTAVTVLRTNDRGENCRREVPIREIVPGDMLVRYFIDRYARKAGKQIRSVSNKTLELLQSYPWPGNIRELQNVIERSVIVCDTENFSVDESWLSRGPVPTQSVDQPLPEKLAIEQKAIIETALAQTRGQVAGPYGAAAKLGMPASTLESKIKTLKISKHRFKSL